MSNQLGGLAKKAHYIKQHKADVDGALILDAGDLLTPTAPGAVKGVSTAADVPVRAAALAKMQAQIGLHALAVGERELALGLKPLQKLAKEHKIRLVSANLVDAKGKPVFEPGFVTEVAGAKVGVFGLTDVPEAQRQPVTEAGLTQQPVEEVATREVARLKAQGATVIIALAHIGVGGARTLLRQVKGIDLAIAGHTSQSIAAPERVGDGYVVEAMRQGKQLGEFRLHLLPGDAPFTDLGAGRAVRDGMATKLREYDRLARTVEREPVETRRKLYLTRLEALRGELTRACESVKQAPPAVTGRWLEHKLVPMDRAAPDDPEIKAAIDKHVEELQKAAAARGPVQPAPSKVATPLPRPTAVKGPAKK